MTEKIYMTDSYAKSINTKVTRKEANFIELEKTIFYPTGGGVPCDNGIISSSSGIYNVVEVKKQEEGAIHILDKNPNFELGEEVNCKIDWDRRYAHMRYHTAVHVISGIATNKYGALFTGNQIYHNKTRFDLDLQSLSRELAQKIIDESQEIIDQNRNILVKFFSKEEALSIPNISRTLPGNDILNKLDTIRIVEIEGFDMQLDGGPHVSNTREIGKLELSSFENKGTKRKRLEIILK